MNDLEEEEDVIIEGSELHQALVSMGYTDFESTPVNKSNFSKQSSKGKWFEIFCNLLKRWYPSKSAFDYVPKSYYLSSKQFTTILRAESLLDDHAELVQSFMERNSQTFWNKFAEWSSLAVSGAMLGIGYSMFKRKKSLAMFFATSVAAFATCQKYEEFRAIRALEDLVAAQNELYHLYKKSLGILKNVHRLRIDGKKPQTKFSKLEIDRLKYLQPLTETLLKSMENISRTYYQVSSMIARLLPENAFDNDTLTHFETNELAIGGEITYESLRHLYYVYILVQSDTMKLLAIAYNADTWMDNERISYSLLTRIIVNLCRSLTNDKNKLARIIVEYESCKRKTIQRKFRLTTASKWRDLYLNLEILSRKLQTAYDEIASILEDIDKRDEDENDETTEDTFIAKLTAKTREIYSEINKSRNFAEFNNLLMVILQRSRRAVDNPISEIDEHVTEIEGDRSIVRDSEPQIIDEVFEEYITEEYLKPLYEDGDEATLESVKFDKLLAKNFMNELKEALVEKYKSMSEREAKALMRKYRETRERSSIEENIESQVTSVEDLEKSIVPCPPPLPGLVKTAEQSREIALERQKKESRGPVPLPRSRNVENISNDHVRQRLNVSVPPPPPPPPLPPSKIEAFENTERFSIDLPKLGARKMPAFVTFVEEFIGSGENSEEELEKSDQDESFEQATTD